MADKLILNANMIRKADRFVPKKCAVEKVIEVSDSEFKTFIENPMKRNYHLPAYKDLMGYYDDTYHGVLFVNMENGDGLLVNSEGYDYARYSQYIPNARGIIRQHEQTAALDDLKKHMDGCIDRWLEQHTNDNKFGISLTDLIDESNFAEKLVDHVSEMLSRDPRIETCELTHNSIEVTKRELVETRLYCPLRFEMDSDDGSEYPEEICSANYVGYDDEINENIRKDINSDEDAVERGLAAYLDRSPLYNKVYSIVPMAETRNGDLYGVAVVQSYGELDSAETIELANYITGQFADGWGEGYEQHPVELSEDEVYISFWNSGDNYFLKPESEVFPKQEINIAEVKLYCPLKFLEEPEDCGGYLDEVMSLHYTQYEDEINEKIRIDLASDKKAVERGLAAYLYDSHLDEKVFSAVPSVEVRDDDIYGVVTVRSYGRLDKSEMDTLIEELTGQLSDGWGEGFEQREMWLGEDKVYISFWNSDNDYFLKPESEVFPDMEINQGMGGLS